jgi:hypothetical protein
MNEHAIGLRGQMHRLVGADRLRRPERNDLAALRAREADMIVAAIFARENAGR